MCVRQFHTFSHFEKDSIYYIQGEWLGIEFWAEEAQKLADLNLQDLAPLGKFAAYFFETAKKNQA